MTLATWLAEPIEPLVFGDGRPATAVRGQVIRSRSLPPPTQLAGVVRSRAGTGADGLFDRSRIPELLELTVLGPHLVRLDPDRPRWLFPAPSDAWLPDQEPPRLALPLRPLALRDGERISGEHAPVGLARRVEGKPWAEAPRWWTDEELLAWLTEPGEHRIVGDPGPTTHRRTHVTVDAATGTAEEGHLFGTEGRHFVRKGATLALAFRTDAPLTEGLAALGGERRLARWREDRRLAFPSIPEAVVASARAGAVRVTWITPALLARGSRPTWLVANAPPGTTIAAQANDRPEVVSGWDYKEREPKPTRRLLPAGSTTWLSLRGTPEEREAWARTTWGTACSDDPQARRDGLGVVLLGAWDGARTPFDTNEDRP